MDTSNLQALLAKNIEITSNYLAERSEKMKVIDNDNYVIVDTCSDIFYLNKIIAKNDISDHDLNDIVKYFSKNNRSALWVKILSDNFTTSVLPFNQQEVTNQKCMCLSLENLKKSKHISAIKINRINTEKNLLDLVSIMSETTNVSKNFLWSYYTQLY